MQLECTYNLSTLAKPEEALCAPSLPILSRFFVKLQNKLHELDKASRAFLAMERELEHFLVSYYTRILPLCETLEALRHGLPLPYARCCHHFSPVKMSDIMHKNDALRLHLKSLYRTLMKIHHPDIAISIKRRPISDIITAYEDHRLGTLWKYLIEHECALHSGRASVARYLKEQYTKVEMLLHDIQTKTFELTASRSWELKERAAEAKLCGVDLIHNTACRIETHIAALHKNICRDNKITYTI